MSNLYNDIVNLFWRPIWPYIGHFVLPLVCAYALTGSWRERLCGIIIFAAYLFAWVQVTITHHALTFTNLVGDLLCLPGFIAINHKSPYSWTRWALGLQLLSVALDIANQLQGGRFDPAFVIPTTAIAYVILIVLLVGTVSTQVRRRREQGAPGQD